MRAADEQLVKGVFPDFGRVEGFVKILTDERLIHSEDVEDALLKDSGLSD